MVRLLKVRIGEAKKQLGELACKARANENNGLAVCAHPPLQDEALNEAAEQYLFLTRNLRTPVKKVEHVLHRVRCEHGDILVRAGVGFPQS